MCRYTYKLDPWLMLISHRGNNMWRKSQRMICCPNCLHCFAFYKWMKHFALKYWMTDHIAKTPRFVLKQSNQGHKDIHTLRQCCKKLEQLQIAGFMRILTKESVSMKEAWYRLYVDKHGVEMSKRVAEKSKTYSTWWKNAKTNILPQDFP